MPSMNKPNRGTRLAKAVAIVCKNHMSFTNAMSAELFLNLVFKKATQHGCKSFEALIGNSMARLAGVNTLLPHCL